MKCFECGSKCLTNYIFDVPSNQSRVVAVNKICISCGWESYPTKIPESI